MPEESNQGPPSWNGDPASFEQFVQNCKWYEQGLKPSERPMAASRVWQKLTGAAKSVVRHLEPSAFDQPNGLSKLLEVLRQSPLQQLPVPDSFSRLERWSSLRRSPQETIPQLLVREEERFVELQQALQRARAERTKMTSTHVGTSAEERDPPSSPSMSPGFGVPQDAEGTTRTSPPTATNVESLEKDFFGDELRGCRLLKAAKLSQQERQHILTLTSNSTRFVEIRRALRTLFAEETSEEALQSRPKRTVWWTSQEWDDWDDDGQQWSDEWWTADENAYWTDDWNTTDGEAYFEEWSDDWSWTDGSPTTEDYEKKDDLTDLGAIPESVEYEEAFTLSQEAAKTLSKAREAVAKVRAARGYYDAAGMKGASKGKGKKGKSKGKQTFGPCFICKSPKHTYQQCPDRHQVRSGTPSGSPSGSPTNKGFAKGKGKMKGKKGKYPSYYVDAYYVDLELYEDVENEIHVMSLQSHDAEMTSQNAFRVIVDTGATESVCGVNNVARLLDSFDVPRYDVCFSDRPVFRFVNGHTQQASSRIDVVTKALEMVSFYVLDGQAENTPALLGGKELWNRLAVVAYCGEYFAHRDVDGAWWTNTLYQLRGRHVAIDLSEEPTRLETTLDRLRNLPPPGDDEGPGDDLEDPGDHHGRRVARRGGSRNRGALPAGFGFSVHGVVRQAAINASGSLDGRRDVRDEDGDHHTGEAAEEVSFGDTGATTAATMPNYIDLDLDSPSTTCLEMPGPPLEPAVLVSQSCAARHQDLVPPSTVLCRVPWCGGRGCRHMQMQPNWVNTSSSTPAAEPAEIVATVEKVMSADEMSVGISPNFTVEPNQNQEHEVPHAVHEHGPQHADSPLHVGSAHVSSGDVEGQVLMVSSCGGEVGSDQHDVTMSDQLQSLARRLADLQDRINGPKQSTRSRSRPASYGMAVPWYPPSGQGAQQPNCCVDHVQEMWPSAFLYNQRPRSWRMSFFGSATRNGAHGTAGVGSRLQQGQHERKDLCGQAAGVERSSASGPKEMRV